MTANKATGKAATQVAAIVEEIIEAGNNLNFDSTRRPWNTFTPDFSALPGLLSKPPGTMTLSQFMTWFQNVSKKHPDLRIDAVEIRVNVKDDCRAECFAVTEYNGVPKGVTRPGVAMYDFVRSEDGRWRCAKLVTMGGLLGDGGDLTIRAPADSKALKEPPRAQSPQIKEEKPSKASITSKKKMSHMKEAKHRPSS